MSQWPLGSFFLFLIAMVLAGHEGFWNCFSPSLESGRMTQKCTTLLKTI